MDNKAAIGVAVLIVVVTTIVFIRRYLRQRRITCTQARRHFVKAASLLADAQKTKSPGEVKSLTQQSIAEADQAIRLDSSDAAYHIVKSLALEVGGSSESAIKELATALARPKSLTIPERSSALVKKAELLLSQSQGHEALEDLQESVALTPKNHRAQMLLGQAYEKDGQISKAIEAFNQAALLDPKSADAKEAAERLARV